jgi:hypothetical protein
MMAAFVEELLDAQGKTFWGICDDHHQPWGSFDLPIIYLEGKPDAQHQKIESRAHPKEARTADH